MCGLKLNISMHPKTPLQFLLGKYFIDISKTPSFITVRNTKINNFLPEASDLRNKLFEFESLGFKVCLAKTEEFMTLHYFEVPLKALPIITNPNSQIQIHKSKSKTDS